MRSIKFIVYALLTTFYFIPDPSTAQSSSVIIPQPKMGSPISKLTTLELARFEKGKRAFQHRVTTAEGLGPAFNDVSCVSCHSQPAVGGASIGLSMAVRRFGRVSSSGGFDPLSSLGGTLLQSRGEFLQDGSGNFLQCSESVPFEANVVATRIPTPLFGLGLVESVPDSALAAFQTSGTSGISGVIHPVNPLEKPSVIRAGRFGWKAQVATSISFAADAALNEQGVTNRLLTQENAPNGNLAKLASCDRVADPENLPFEGTQFIDAVSDFQRFLAPPPQTPQSGLAGEAKFVEIGCAHCHVAKLQTATDSALEIALNNITIRPYSDFLLHDMGSAQQGGLGDGIVQGLAARNEMRTAPLWGLVGRIFLGHDARASTNFMFGAPCFPGSPCTAQSMQFAEDNLAGAVRTIVQLHAAPGSEAAEAANRYLSLSSAETKNIVQFLMSLGRAPFDASYDGVIDNFDLQRFRLCFLMTAIAPAHECSVFDLNANKKIDTAEAEAFIRVYGGPRGDCNCNSVPDPMDILSGVSLDSNGDGRPDSCPPLGSNCARSSFAFKYPGEYIEVPLRDSLVLGANNTGFSGAFWLRLKQAVNGKYQTILDHPGTFSLGLLSSNGRRLSLQASTSATRSQILNSTTDLPLNTWVHVAFSYENSATQRSLTLYLNGVKSAELLSMANKIVPSSSSLYLGDSPKTGSLANVEISGLSIFKRNLAQNEIVGLMNSTPSSTDASLALAYNFVQIQSQRVLDSSLSQNNGFVFGPDVSPPSIPAQFFPSRIGSSLRLSWTSSDDNLGDRKFISNEYINGVYSRQSVSSGPTLTVSSVVPGATYLYDVTAYDGAGNSSRVGRYVLVDEPIPPSNPSSMRYSRDLLGNLNVSWNVSTDNVGVAGYQVSIYKNNVAMGTIFDEAPSYTVGPAEANAAYRFNVYAYDQAGNRSPGYATISVPAL